MLTTPSSSSTANNNLYGSQAEMVKSLHQAFIDHVYPPSRPDSHGDPSTFDRLQELRSARENMHKTYALGEDLWAEWIQDETILAKSVEENVAVMEKCSQAVTEEYGSVKLWIIFGEWLHHTHRLYHQVDDKETPVNSTEEVSVGREIFSWQVVLETWQHGAEDTMWRINDSHKVWNAYMALLLQDLSHTGSQEAMPHIRSLFDVRLQTPHADWDGTFQAFSSFVSTYYSADYEEIMVATNRKAVDAKSKWEAREGMEAELTRSQESADTIAESMAFANYLQWERTPEKRRRVSVELTNALYQRAALRFPTQPQIWEDHILWLVEQTHTSQVALQMLATLERATRHCPWAGALWSHYLLASEREGQSFSETEEIKHKATSTGLLEASGMNEVIKVHTAWCTYLRRRAVQADSTDEDADVAEMGIRSSIENLHEVAAGNLDEQSSVVDPTFRLERIYVNFLTENGNRDTAREIFRGLIPKLGNSWQFWLHFYTWEMARWTEVTSQEASEDGLSSKQSSTPHYATALLRQALQREDLDWPEKIIEAYITHCEDYAEVAELQMALVEVRKVEQVIARKREAAAYWMAEHAQSNTNALLGSETAEAPTGKRKRQGDDVNQVESRLKKSKISGVDRDDATTASAPEKSLKRDRENATILVQGLPDSVSETRLRQFFRDCGTVNNLKLMQQNGTSAVVEFNEKEAAQFAQSRDGKILDGEPIHIQHGSGSTLFVANFPPSADESYIRSLFDPFGQIVDIRFPSLKYNTHRRFCYVQFQLNAEAQAAAAELDGTTVDEGLKLVSKISNPAVKQDRSGAMEEGREVYCRNIPWNASEEDVRILFAKYGEVESVRIPRKIGGHSKGFCFVIFASEEAANAATALNGHTFMSRELHVELSSKTGAKRQATTVVALANSAHNGGTDPTPASPSSATSSTLDHHSSLPVTSSHPRARTIALLRVPDTINTSRIHALAEPYGPLVKIVLRPDHQGAIIEYADEAHAGRAALALQDYEIVPGRHIRVGAVPELLKEKDEKKPTDKIQVGKAKTGGSSTNNVNGNLTSHKTLPSRPLAPPQSLGAVKRPGQPENITTSKIIRSGGRRGGLGQKTSRSGSSFSGRNGIIPTHPSTTTEDTTTTPTTRTTPSTHPSDRNTIPNVETDHGTGTGTGTTSAGTDTNNKKAKTNNDFRQFISDTRKLPS